MPRQVPHLKVLLLISALVAVGSFAVPVHGQDQQATVSVVAPDSVSASADHVDVNIDVSGAQDLAGFQFVLTVDAALLRPASAQQTPFLAETGREIFCDDPTIEEAAIRFACVTLRLTPAGVDGSGTLAVVSLEPLGRGTSPLSLSHVELVHPDGSVLASTSVNGDLKLGGEGSLPWWRVAIGAGGAGVIVILAGAFVLRRRRARQVVQESDPLADGS